MEHSIDEIIKKLGMAEFQNGVKSTKGIDSGVLSTATQETLTAIYEIGLECIGADEPLNKAHETNECPGCNIVDRNELRASQRKAWAKACGVKL